MQVTGIPRRAATSIATPAACAVPITVCTLCWAKTRSIATAVGRCSVIQASTVSSISTRRRAVSSSAGVRTTSTAISRGWRPGSAVHHAETAAGQARVDAQHPHVIPLRLSDRTAHAIPFDIA